MFGGQRDHRFWFLIFPLPLISVYKCCFKLPRSETDLIQFTCLQSHGIKPLWRTWKYVGSSRLRTSWLVYPLSVCCLPCRSEMALLLSPSKLLGTNWEKRGRPDQRARNVRERYQTRIMEEGNKCDDGQNSRKLTGVEWFKELARLGGSWSWIYANSAPLQDHRKSQTCLFIGLCLQNFTGLLNLAIELEKNISTLMFYIVMFISTIIF